MVLRGEEADIFVEPREVGWGTIGNTRKLEEIQSVGELF